MSDETRPELDQPEEEGYGLLYPFTCVKSNGGKYDDDAFVAGVAVGQIDKGLEVALAAGANRYRATVRTDLLSQLDLVGMARGWPVNLRTTTEYPEWTVIEFMLELPEEEPGDD